LKRRIRVLLAKPGLDGHDKGVKLVARDLKDAGMEVVYLGMRLSAEAILNVAAQEDVDVIGISILSGVHTSFAQKLMRRTRELGLDEIPIIFGGVIPEEDIPVLKELGVREVFPVGSAFEDIRVWIENNTVREDDNV
jgi:methylmalonyl-CoA mutase C-terminal domain/subunit